MEQVQVGNSQLTLSCCASAFVAFGTLDESVVGSRVCLGKVVTAEPLDQLCHRGPGVYEEPLRHAELLAPYTPWIVLALQLPPLLISEQPPRFRTYIEKTKERLECAVGF